MLTYQYGFPGVLGFLNHIPSTEELADRDYEEEHAETYGYYEYALVQAVEDLATLIVQVLDQVVLAGVYEAPCLTLSQGIIASIAPSIVKG